MKEEDDILKNKFILPAQARMFLAFSPSVFPLPGSLKHMVWKNVSSTIITSRVRGNRSIFGAGKIRILSNSDYVFRLSTSKRKWRHAILQRNEGRGKEKCMQDQPRFLQSSSFLVAIYSVSFLFLKSGYQ